MKTKARLIKAAAIVNYAFTALWFVVTACFFALSNNLYWMFLVFALATLYTGFVTMSVKDNMTGVNLTKKENTKLLVCWILSILSPASFVLLAIAYFYKKEDDEKAETPATESKQTETKTADTVKEEKAAEATVKTIPVVPANSKEAEKAKPVNVAQEKQSKGKQFCKKASFITMCASFLLIFVFGFSGMCFETSGFKVKVTDFTLTKEMTEKYNNGEIYGKPYVIGEETDESGKTHTGSYSVTMYVPKTATEANPAPTIFVLPGFTRTKMTMAQYCIELSRRGAVVFCMDPGAQGSTTANSTAGANGIEYLVQYVYNNTDDFKFCDKTRFGAVGHSAGGGNVITLASDMAGGSYYGFENSQNLQIENSPYMNENGYIYVLNRNNPRQLSALLYEFMSGEKLDKTADIGELKDKTLTVSVWNNLEEEKLNALKKEFNTFLTGKGINISELNITWRVETANYENSVKTAGDVDFILNVSSNDGITTPSIIKAVYDSGYIKISAANKFKNLKCNAAMSYAYYDEGAFRYQTDTTAVEVIAKRFINEVNGSNLGIENVEYEKGYGSMTDGTYRIVHREKTNHCFEMYDNLSIANTVDFFNETLEIGSSVKGTKQIWFGKEFSNGLALAAAFTFIIALLGVLMETPFFATLKTGGKVKGEVSGAELKSLDSPVPSKTIARKIIFWTSMILTAIIACLDYIPLANLSIEIFPTSNLASVFTFTFPARMVNAILLWALINGAIGLVIFFAVTALENLYEYVMYKAKGITPHYDWSKYEAIKIRGNGWKNVLFNVLKTLLLPIIMFGAFYFTLQLSFWCFHQDFRFMLVSASPINGRMFVTMLEYVPIIFVFYISNSIRVNCSIGKEGWKEWKVLLTGALANSIGLAFILLINYVCYFVTGTPYYGYWGNNNEVWLFVNMVFALVVMMFILPIFNRITYKKTGNVWVGAITWCLIFIMMTISASVSYIPIY